MHTDPHQNQQTNGNEYTIKTKQKQQNTKTKRALKIKLGIHFTVN